MFLSTLLYAHVLAGIVTLIFMGAIGLRVTLKGALTTQEALLIQTALLWIAAADLLSGALLVVVSPGTAGLGMCAGVVLYIAAVCVCFFVLQRYRTTTTLPASWYAVSGSVGVFCAVVLGGW